MNLKTTFVIAALTGLFLLASAPAPASAQSAGASGAGYLDSTLLGVGFVANAPDQLVGFGVTTIGFPASAWGVHVNMKISTGSPGRRDNFTEERTAEEAEALGDTRFGSVDGAYTSVNLAVVRALGDDVAAYAGAGFTRETVYQEFEDPDGERGMLGFYTVEDRRLGGDTVNLVGGLFLRAGRAVSFQIGGETDPAGFTVGASLVFPIGE